MSELTDPIEEPLISAQLYRLKTGHYETSDDSEIKWLSNYKEAALYLHEGENNDKFAFHPKKQEDLTVYMITHSTWFHILQLSASILLLSLALIEQPSSFTFSFNIFIHCTIEIIVLIIIGVELFFQIKYLGLKASICHTRTIIKAVVLVVMLSESILVSVRQTNHLRITRSLRPVYVLDSFYCRGVRRFIRQIMMSLPQIIEMLILIIFFLLLYTILGFYFFSNVVKDTYFKSITESFISLFILLTTANYPDVMMPVYSHSRWSSLFFISFISIEIFLFMNLFQAVVYSAFINNEKDKFRKLLLHRRRACKAAFKLLLTLQKPNTLSLKHFLGLVRYFKPKLSKIDQYLLFKCLNENKNGFLTLNEFMNIYDASNLQWHKESKQTLLYSDSYFVKIQMYINQFVMSKWFKILIYIVLSCHLLWIIIYTVKLSVVLNATSWKRNMDTFLWISIVFVSIYILETLLKIIGLGKKQYFASHWNIFDFIVTICSLLELIVQIFYLIAFFVSPLRVLRLFTLRKSYCDIFATLYLLLPRVISLSIVLLLLYYFFAIIGMEIFAPYTNALINCCQNTSVQQFYAISNISNYEGFYYYNTFENIIISGVTLFELTVVNNWWIIMEGYANVTSPWTRIYFMIFYLIIMIVMAVVVAFILEAFIFHIQCKKDLQINIGSKVKIKITLNHNEWLMVEQKERVLEPIYSSQEVLSPNDEPEEILFEGNRRIHKRDYYSQMYKQEIDKWIKNDEVEENYF